jgi:hypothetical protein|tara:strand:+ start:98 stop:337 length:240 start_codon:yes stop_codon:yes gene_type:complete
LAADALQVGVPGSVPHRRNRDIPHGTDGLNGNIKQTLAVEERNLVPTPQLANSGFEPSAPLITALDAFQTTWAAKTEHC